MKVTKLNIVGGDKIEWLLDAAQVSLNVPNILQAEMDGKQKSIFVLSGVADSIPLELRVVSIDGQGVDLCVVPEGFSFSYLTHHPSLGVAVVASANEKVDGWYDWHFGYDQNKAELYRFCPAY
jgi:hypothetical protein